MTDKIETFVLKSTSHLDANWSLVKKVPLPVYSYTFESEI